MEKRTLLPALFIAASLLIAASIGYAHEKVKLTGYVLDEVCYTSDVKGAGEGAAKAAADHSKECALMEECIKSGFGLYADGKWYPFDAKGNELAKALFEKSSKTKQIKVTVEGVTHEGKLQVQKISETE